jgi:putative ABC transport system permease protein
MKLSELVRIAWRSVRSNRLRTALTTLGVVIGVSAVIVLVGFGDGLKAGFTTQFGALGTQLVVTKVAGSVPGGQAAHDITDADAEALRDSAKAPAVSQVSGGVAGTALATYDQRHYRCSLAGVEPDYLSMVNHTLAAGTFFTSTQERDRARVVVLGTHPATTLFGPDINAALGHRVRIGRSSFTVIGILSSNGQADDAAVVPLTTARVNFVGGTDTLNQIIVRATSVGAVAAAQDQITSILSRRHNTRDSSQRDFEIQAMQNLLEQATQFLGYLTLFTVASVRSASPTSCWSRSPNAPARSVSARPSGRPDGPFSNSSSSSPRFSGASVARPASSSASA